MIEIEKDATTGAQSKTCIEIGDKGTHYNQLHQTQLAFFGSPKTMMMVAREINCDRGNICWYVEDLREANALWLVRTGTCPVTRHTRVGFWTSNPALAPKIQNQPSLFDDEKFQ